MKINLELETTTKFIKEKTNKLIKKSDVLRKVNKSGKN